MGFLICFVAYLREILKRFVPQHPCACLPSNVSLCVFPFYQLGFAGALVRQGDSRLSKRVMFGRLAVQGPKRGGRPATSWVDCLQKNLEAFDAVPRKGKGRKWVAFGVVVKDGRDWMTAAKNMDKWHRGVERGAEALDSAWRRADLRQSNV